MRWARIKPRRFIERFEDIGRVSVIPLGESSPPARAPTRSVQERVPNALSAPDPGKRHTVSVAVIEHGHLATQSGVVMSREGAIVRQSLFDIEHERRIAAAKPRLKRATPVGGTCASLATLWSDNFFHWMMDALPRIATIERAGIPIDRFIVPEKLQPFQRESLAALRIDGDRLQPFTGEHVVVERLVWASPPGPIGQPVADNVNFLRDRLGPQDRPAGDKLVYLRRRGSRRARNEPEVEAVLRARGFHSIDPAALPLTQQIATLAEASLVVGCHGAGFVNAVFSEWLTGLELYNPNHINSSILNLFGVLGHPHWTLVCHPVPARRGAIRDRDVTVDLDELRSTLDSIAAADRPDRGTPPR
jgi:capsular polysaccharide biosynthesis protein